MSCEYGNENFFLQFPYTKEKLNLKNWLKCNEFNLNLGSKTLKNSKKIFNIIQNLEFTALS